MKPRLLKGDFDLEKFNSDFVPPPKPQGAQTAPAASTAAPAADADLSQVGGILIGKFKQIKTKDPPKNQNEKCRISHFLLRF